MKHVETSTRTRAVITSSIKLTGEDIIHLINSWRRGHGVGTIPKDATVDFGVPGGGDYSNTTLDIDEHTPIEVRWTKVEESE